MTPEQVDTIVLDLITDPVTAPEMRRKLDYTAENLARLASMRKANEASEDQLKREAYLTRIQKDLVSEATRGRRAA